MIVQVEIQKSTTNSAGFGKAKQLTLNRAKALLAMYLTGFKTLTNRDIDGSLSIDNYMRMEEKTEEGNDDD